jgi:TPR repeat protein
MMALGDYSAARRLYQRTVPAGSAQGARGVARTYDPAVLGPGSPEADPAAAATWYGLAATLGNTSSAPQSSLSRSR